MSTQCFVWKLCDCTTIVHKRIRSSTLGLNLRPTYARNHSHSHPRHNTTRYVIRAVQGSDAINPIQPVMRSRLGTSVLRKHSSTGEIELANLVRSGTTRIATCWSFVVVRAVSLNGNAFADSERNSGLPADFTGWSSRSATSETCRAQTSPRRTDSRIDS